MASGALSKSVRNSAPRPRSGRAPPGRAPSSRLRPRRRAPRDPRRSCPRPRPRVHHRHHRRALARADRRQRQLAWPRAPRAPSDALAPGRGGRQVRGDEARSSARARSAMARGGGRRASTISHGLSATRPPLRPGRPPSRELAGASGRKHPASDRHRGASASAPRASNRAHLEIYRRFSEAGHEIRTRAALSLGS